MDCGGLYTFGYTVAVCHLHLHLIVAGCHDDVAIAVAG